MIELSMQHHFDVRRQGLELADLGRPMTIAQRPLCAAKQAGQPLPTQSKVHHSAIHVRSSTVGKSRQEISRVWGIGSSKVRHRMVCFASTGAQVFTLPRYLPNAALA